MTQRKYHRGVTVLEFLILLPFILLILLFMLNTLLISEGLVYSLIKARNMALEGAECPGSHSPALAQFESPETINLIGDFPTKAVKTKGKYFIVYSVNAKSESSK